MVQLARPDSLGSGGSQTDAKAEEERNGTSGESEDEGAKGTADNSTESTEADSTDDREERTNRRRQNGNARRGLYFAKKR